MPYVETFGGAGEIRVKLEAMVLQVTLFVLRLSSGNETIRVYGRGILEHGVLGCWDLAVQPESVFGNRQMVGMEDYLY